MFNRIVALMLLLSFFYLSAKEYDLQTVLRLAEENNKQIQLAQADLKTAAAEKMNAFSAAFPEIDVTGGYNRNLKENVFYFVIEDQATGEKVTQSFRNYSGAVFRSLYQL
jgi:outer membrane protein TolC